MYPIATEFFMLICMSEQNYEKLFTQYPHPDL